MKSSTLVAGLWLIACSSFSWADTVSLPVTTSHARLIVALWEGDIDVTMSEGGEVRITADCKSVAPQAAVPGGEFRSLRSSATLPEIVTSDEVIAIRTHEDAPRCSVTVAVPGRLDLHARVNFEGSISVHGWDGRLVAWSASGNVDIVDHSGSLSVTAMNGDATVSLGDEGIDADSAITSANGTLTLTVDPNAVPQLRAQARWGDIQTNLDTTFEQVVEADGTWFATKAVSGDPLLTMRNLNRDIVIRSSSP